MSSLDTAVHPAPARSRLVSGVRQDISDGRLSAGTRLNERELCELYDVSRTVVREGLRQLEGEGFVTIEAHRGAVVASISYQDAEHLFEVRGALEALACSLFARRGSVDCKRALARATTRTAEAMESGDLATVLAAKDAFYDALLAGAGNPELEAALRLLHARIRLLRRYSLSADNRYASSLSEITAICEAIVAGDIEGARRAGEHHVAQAARAALPRIFDELCRDSM
ncbi:GntR family transcriptional regulator [Mycolicibacterium murale]|jgi:DNA-binding GntR family transcriptional regulator|uniref:GntR family transcriptional regulator n=1 Tax=Mycolicibacterium murale TaxID=182220 RepID=A0A7I9WX59_9MYCO|nr:GntR family transcriptional regulator [Mycolicibacterium murale]ANW62652.1 GntR family transcriptional regulator [Mycobacterium sp. djl-10]MCV7182012.1 GntR family transcriptional regulator [Mycolicibacterium murale]GFG62313.1 GntR family transcriptional regulator [Mycolicibacterium murale]